MTNIDLYILLLYRAPSNPPDLSSKIMLVVKPLFLSKLLLPKPLSNNVQTLLTESPEDLLSSANSKSTISTKLL